MAVFNHGLPAWNTDNQSYHSNGSALFHQSLAGMSEPWIAWTSRSSGSLRETYSLAVSMGLIVAPGPKLPDQEIPASYTIKIPNASPKSYYSHYSQRCLFQYYYHQFQCIAAVSITTILFYLVSIFPYLQP